MKTEQQVLTYGDEQIIYHLRYRERKSLSITVSPDMRVTVNSPKTCSSAEVAVAIKRKARWILRQLREFESYRPLPTPHNFVSGETFIYLGRQYRLKVNKGEEVPAKLRGRFLHLTLPDPGNKSTVRRLVQDWYRIRARETFGRYLKRCLEIAQRHGAKTPTLSIRKMRTRWGSCSAAGRITLNLHLIHAPVHCIEYVIMHELCHLVHHNHSLRFYRLLTTCMPDWQKRRELLKQVVVPVE